LSEPKKIKIRIQLNQNSFRRYVKLAEEMGLRRGGLLLFKQKKNGFEGELSPNTTGLTKAFKRSMDYYSEHEAEILRRKADLVEKDRELQEEKKKLGLV